MRVNDRNADVAKRYRYDRCINICSCFGSGSGLNSCAVCDRSAAALHIGSCRSIRVRLGKRTGDGDCSKGNRIACQGVCGIFNDFRFPFFRLIVIELRCYLYAFRLQTANAVDPGILDSLLVTECDIGRDGEKADRDIVNIRFSLGSSQRVYFDFVCCQFRIRISQDLRVVDRCVGSLREVEGNHADSGRTASYCCFHIAGFYFAFLVFGACLHFHFIHGSGLTSQIDPGCIVRCVAGNRYLNTNRYCEADSYCHAGSIYVTVYGSVNVHLRTMLCHSALDRHTADYCRVNRCLLRDCYCACESSVKTCRYAYANCMDLTCDGTAYIDLTCSCVAANREGTCDCALGMCFNVIFFVLKSNLIQISRLFIGRAFFINRGPACICQSSRFVDQNVDGNTACASSGNRHVYSYNIVSSMNDIRNIQLAGL